MQVLIDRHGERTVKLTKREKDILSQAERLVQELHRQVGTVDTVAACNLVTQEMFAAMGGKANG